LAKIKNREDFNYWGAIFSIIKSGSYYFFSNIFLAVTAFIFWIFLAKRFSPDNYGQVRTIYAIVAIISALMQFGLPTYNQLIFSSNKEYSDEYGKVVSLKIILIVLYFIIVIGYFIVDNRQYNAVYIAVIIIIFFLEDIVRYLAGIFYGSNDFNIVFRSSFVSRLILLILTVVIFIAEFKLSYYLFILLLANLVQFSVLITNKKYQKIIFHIPKLNLSKMKSLFLIIFPLGMNNIFNLAYDKIDLPLISYYIDFNHVAQYSIAYSIYTLSGTVFGILLIPAFNYFSNNNIYQYKKKLFYRTALLMILCSFFIIGCFYFLGKPLIIFLLGTKYFTAAVLLPYFSLSIIFWGLNSLCGIYLNAQSHFKVTMYASIAGLAANVIIDVITLPYLGIIGGVIATTSTMLIVLAIEMFFILKFIRA
jgi:stage V sporulation protein B